jgi:hypothetical protein
LAISTNFHEKLVIFSKRNIMCNDFFCIKSCILAKNNILAHFLAKMCMFDNIGPGIMMSGNLMSQLVGDDDGDPLLGDDGRLRLREEQRVLSVRDEAPVLHGAGAEVRNGDEICTIGC